MAIGRAGKTINDLSDKVFSIVKASGGGSTGGGSTGGGNTGGGTDGGATGGGRDEDATVDDPTGPVAGDDGGDVEATLRITSPSPGQEIEKGETVTVAWAATGAARDMDICLKVIDPLGEVYLGTYRGLRQITWSFQSSTVELGQWIIQASALFEGDRCSATVNNFCSDCDNPRWRVYVFVEAPQPPAVHPGATYCWDNTHAQGAGAGNGWVKGANACGEGMTGCYSNVMSYVSHWAPQDSALWLADCAIDPINCTQCRGGSASCCTGD